MLALRGGVWNIGGEGQLAVGAATAFLVLEVTRSWPPAIGMLLAFGAAALGGAIWALIPAVLRALRGVSEILTTLLMNYVALAIFEFALTKSFLLGEEGSIIPVGPPIADGQHLPLIWAPTRLHLGFILALGLALALDLFFRAPAGFRIDLLGGNTRLAAQAGVRPPLAIAGLLLWSAAIAGVAGAVQLMGTEFRLSLAITGGLGYMGLLVAVLGGGRAGWTVVAALGFAALSSGSGGAENLGVPRSIVLVIQGLIIVAVLFQRRYRR